MSEHYITIAKDNQVETEIKKSRFICVLHRIEDEQQAKNWIATYKKEHPKANHCCFAFVLGQKAEIQRSSDDGEPSGTAGVPILEVLMQNQLVNVLAVVIRYFGGTKLGAGGLIRAYSTATSHALATTGLVEVRQEQQLLVTIDYPQADKLTHYLETHAQPIQDTTYTDKVCFSLFTATPDVLTHTLTDFLNGHVQIEQGIVANAEYPFLVTD